MGGMFYKEKKDETPILVDNSEFDLYCSYCGA